MLVLASHILHVLLLFVWFITICWWDYLYARSFATQGLQQCREQAEWLQHPGMCWGWWGQFPLCFPSTLISGLFIFNGDSSILWLACTAVGAARCIWEVVSSEMWFRKARDVKAEKEGRLKAWRQMQKKLQLRWKKVALLVNFADQINISGVISDANKDRAFLRQDLDCLVSWILLESWCIHRAAGKVTYTQAKNAGYVFSFRLRTRKQKFWKGCRGYFGWRNDCEFPVRSWCYGADAILGQVHKGIEEGMMSLLDMGLLRDLLNSVSSAHAQTPRKDAENWKSNTKTTALEILPCNGWLKKLYKSFLAYPKEG